MNAKELLLAYISLNVAFYIVAASSVLPYSLAPLQSYNDIQTKLIGGLLTLGIGGLIAAIAGNWLFGAAALVLFSLQFFVGGDSILTWAFYGFPNFVGSVVTELGVGSAALSAITNGVFYGLGSVVWFWFVMQILSGRTSSGFDL